MNIILFEPSETFQPLPVSDRRARHVLDVLGFGVGDAFDAGLINGPRGKARIVALDQREMRHEETRERLKAKYEEALEILKQFV